MSLIDQISEATANKHLVEPFTTEELKTWIVTFKILKDDGEVYAESSINAILSNSDTKNNPTSNLNRKVLKSHLNELGKKVYHF